MANYTKNLKYCSTCAYWTGARKIDNYGQRVTVQIPSERGKCAIPQGPCRNRQTLAINTCIKWEKWPVLK